MNDKASLYIDKMKREKLPAAVIDTFVHYYTQLTDGCSGLIPEDELKPLCPDEISDFDQMERWKSKGKDALNKCVIIKLNGGLGTTMGLNSAKSLIPVKDDLSFLDITALQVRNLNSFHNTLIPILLMNSFKTDKNSLKLMEKYVDLKSSIPFSFIQHKFPKILKSTMEPACWPSNPVLEWNPPGHGDLFTALISSGILEELIRSGYHYAFISNIDNLGATLDTGILGYFSARNLSLLMEVTERSYMDRKGGHLARHNNGKLILRESAQCPEEDRLHFQNINLHRYFNTNNLWLNLFSLRDVLRKNDNILNLPVILNTKNLDPRDDTSPGVYQLETAMGSAISVFESTAALRVPRRRFAPVKNCEELLLLWSDYYRLTDDFRVILNPQRKAAHVDINLDPTFYGRIDQLQERFPFGAPSLIDCESLTIQGDVRFQSDVKISGSVTIRNLSSKQATIRENSNIETDLKFV